MTIKQLISGKVSLLTTNGGIYSFVNCEESYSNMMYDETTKPYVMLAMPTILRPKIVMGGGWVEVYECLVSFLFKSQLDDNEIVQSTHFENAKTGIRELMIRLENDVDNVRNLNIQSIEQIQHVDDCNRSGAFVKFSFEIINSDGVCV
jgi:hypothetical protein